MGGGVGAGCVGQRWERRDVQEAAFLYNSNLYLVTDSYHLTQVPCYYPGSYKTRRKRPLRLNISECLGAWVPAATILTSRPEVDIQKDFSNGSSHMDQSHSCLPLSTVSRATSSYHCPPENSQRFLTTSRIRVPLWA